MRFAAVIAIIVGLGATARAETGAPAGDFVIVIDRSMDADKLAAVTKAVAAGLASFDVDDRVAVIGFAEKASVVARLQRVGTGRAVARVVTALRTGTGENLVAGMRSALDVLHGSKRKRRHVVVITDGSTQLGVERMAQKLSGSGITISAVGYQSLNQATLTLIAKRSGGYHYVVEEPAELTRSLVAERVPMPEHKDALIVFVIDRSASMQGARLEAAKEMVRVATQRLHPEDYVAVIAFDTQSSVVVRPQRAANRASISAEVAKLEIAGDTELFWGLKGAHEMMKGFTVPVKQVLLLTDGEGPSENVVALVTDMHAAKITVSAIGLAGADRDLLAQIAEAGQGRLYMVDDVTKLPALFDHAVGLSP